MSALDQIKTKLANSMQGRYGMDGLSLAMAVTGMVVYLVGTLTDLVILSIVALALLVFSVFRTYSRNIPQRAKELAAYQKALAKPKAWVSLTRKRWVNRKTTRYFKCEGCGTTLSVPANKGKVRTTCPKCLTQTTRKS